LRNVFVSYSHRLDQDDADRFRVRFGVKEGGVSDRSLENINIGHLSDDTIKNNYIRPRIANSSVTIILLGQETGGRWWCDWEIYYSLLKTSDKSENKTKNDYFLEMFAELLSWIVLFYFGLLKFQPLYNMIKVVLRDANQTFEFGCVFGCYFCVKFHFYNDCERRSEF
jgi:hypothetical protein